MDHLGVLKKLTRVTAALNVAGAVGAGLATRAAWKWSEHARGGSLPSEVALRDRIAGDGRLIAGCFVALAVGLVVAAVLHWRAGTLIRQGRGRRLLTALSVVQAFTLPLGIPFAAYALWVCWVHQPTKSFFTASEGGREAWRVEAFSDADARRPHTAMASRTG